jgi:hypothetical protein
MCLADFKVLLRALFATCGNGIALRIFSDLSMEEAVVSVSGKLAVESYLMYSSYSWQTLHMMSLNVNLDSTSVCFVLDCT